MLNFHEAGDRISCLRTDTKDRCISNFSWCDGMGSNKSYDCKTLYDELNYCNDLNIEVTSNSHDGDIDAQTYQMNNSCEITFTSLGVNEPKIQSYIESVSYTHLTLPTTPYV